MLFGDGDFGFDLHSSYAVGDAPVCLTLANWNGSDSPDVLVGHLASDDVHVFACDGHGGLAQVAVIELGREVESLSVAHIDQDLNSDILAAGSSGVTIVYGAGGGQHEPPQYLPSSQMSRGVLADVDLDGAMDIVLASWNPGNVEILRGRGDRTFAPPQIYSTGCEGFTNVICEDLDGDSLLDVACVAYMSGQVATLMNSQSQGFSDSKAYSVGAQPNQMTVIELNGDAYPDIVTANGLSDDLSVLIGDAEGGFISAPRYDSTLGPIDLWSEDFDEDGLDDLAVAHEFGTHIEIWMGQPDGTLVYEGEFYPGYSHGGLDGGDLNADGHWDLVVTLPFYDKLKICLGNGDGTFT